MNKDHNVWLKNLYSYVPLHNNRFILLGKLETKEQLPSLDDSDEPMKIEGQPKVGISDAAKNNKLFSNLLVDHDLDSSSNSDIKSALLQQLSANFEEDKNTIPKHIFKESLEFSQTSREEERKHIETDIITLWKVHRYSIKSISAKMLISKEIVNRILSKYRSLVRKQCQINKKQNFGRRLKVTPEHIDKMREVWERQRDKPIYIRDVKNAVWSALRSSDIPSNSTVSSIMKRELKMSYHLLEKKHRKATMEEGVRKFIQAFALQIELNKSEIELIFIDEFSFSSRK